MTTLQRYVLLQVPGWLLVAIALVWLWPKLDLPVALGVGLWLAWVAKDFLLYPVVRSAYERGVATGAARLIGERGVVVQSLRPRGQVKVRGEIWWARAHDGTELAAGTTVLVVGVENLTLRVERVGAATRQTPPARTAER